MARWGTPGLASLYVGSHTECLQLLCLSKCVTKFVSDGASFSLPRPVYLSYFWDQEILKKLKTGIRVYRTIFSIVTFIF